MDSVAKVAIATTKMFVSPYFVSVPGEFKGTDEHGEVEEFSGSHTIVFKPLFIKIGDQWEYEDTDEGKLFVKKARQSKLSFVLEHTTGWDIVNKGADAHV